MFTARDLCNKMNSIHGERGEREGGEKVVGSLWYFFASLSTWYFLFCVVVEGQERARQ